MSATVPTAYPFPFSNGGGTRHSHATRPLRGPQTAYVRQPYLGSPPAVASLTGFGAGAGAFVRNNGSDADQSQGMVVIRCGLNPTSNGAIGLSFPAGIEAGQYVFLADWALLTQDAPAGDVIVLTAIARTLLSNEVLHFAYQWAVSQ